MMMMMMIVMIIIHNKDGDYEGNDGNEPGYDDEDD